MKKLLLITLCCLCLFGCDSNTETPDNQNDDSTNQNNSSINEEPTYSVNKPFTFDDLEITISDKYSFDTIDNEFSDHDKQTVIKLPVTIKNLKNETHSLNMFYYSFFGSKGTELDSVSSYFDDSVDFAGDLKQDASYDKYFYLLYDGDGTYTIEFDDWSNKISIDIEIKK